MYHAASFDTSEIRHGLRVLGMGEKPYYDPNSTSRADALAGKKKVYGVVTSGLKLEDNKKSLNGSVKNGVTDVLDENKPVNESVKNGDVEA